MQFKFILILNFTIIYCSSAQTDIHLNFMIILMKSITKKLSHSVNKKLNIEDYKNYNLSEKGITKIQLSIWKKLLA